MFVQPDNYSAIWLLFAPISGNPEGHSISLLQPHPFFLIYSSSLNTVATFTLHKYWAQSSRRHCIVWYRNIKSLFFENGFWDFGSYLGLVELVRFYAPCLCIFYLAVYICMPIPVDSISNNYIPLWYKIGQEVAAEQHCLLPVQLREAPREVKETDRMQLRCHQDEIL